MAVVTMATEPVSWVTAVLIGFLLSLDLIPKVSGWSEHTETSAHRIQVVDNDPEFLVGAKGIEKPFCFHLESPENDVIRLLQDPASGIVVNARVFHDKHSNKSYLGTIYVGGQDIRVLAKQHDIIINDQKYGWLGMKATDVRGHRIVVGANMVAMTFRRKRITLIVRRHFVSREIDEDLVSNESHEDDENKASQPETSNETVEENDRGDFPPDAPIRRKRNTGGDDNNNNTNDNNNKNVDNTSSHQASFKRARHRHGSRHGSHKKHKRLRGRRHRKSFYRHESNRHLQEVTSSTDVRTSAHFQMGQEGKTVYLGVYISDSRDFSNATHGLLGQFLFKDVMLEKINYKNGRVKARFIIDQDKNRRTIALLSLRKNVALNTTRACWRVRHQGRDVIDGAYEHYVVPSMRYSLMMQLPPHTPL